MKVHFIGVGGIGVSALAQYYLAQGHQVSGSDLAQSEITDLLEKKGAKIFTGPHKARNLQKSTDMVIYTPAARLDNPELKEAFKIKNSYLHQDYNRRAKLKIRIFSYPEALGELTKKYFTIAVSGTHGKSTTTAMIALILAAAGYDPTVVLGTKVHEFGGNNFRKGKSKYLVIEADEHFASFLRYWPKIIVVTNIDKDHLDYYKNLGNIKKAFKEYVKHLPPDGLLIFNNDDKNTWELKLVSKRPGFKTKPYSLRQKEAIVLKKIMLLPGRHNVANALAALAVAREVGIPDKTSFAVLAKYTGSWRRFEIISQKPFTVISDYGHHPAEIIATLETAKEKFPKRKIWIAFQPHQYQRTFYLFNDFVKAFDAADNIIIADIFDVAGREEKNISGKISSRKLADEVRKRKKNTFFVADFRKIPAFLRQRADKKDVIIIMGAGNIYNISKLALWR